MDSQFYEGLTDFDTRCSFLTVGRQMTLNAYTVDLTELFHHSPGTKLSSQQEGNTDSTPSSIPPEVERILFPNMRDSRR